MFLAQRMFLTALCDDLYTGNLRTKKQKQDTVLASEELIPSVLAGFLLSAYHNLESAKKRALAEEFSRSG